jgi:hypothetical protein
VELDTELWSENLQCEVTVRVLTDMAHCWVVNMVIKFQALKRVGDIVKLFLCSPVVMRV